MSSPSNKSKPKDSASPNRLLAETKEETLKRILASAENFDESLIEKAISDGGFDDIFTLYEGALGIDDRFSDLDEPTSLGRWHDLFPDEDTTSTLVAIPNDHNAPNKDHLAVPSAMIPEMNGTKLSRNDTRAMR